MKYLFWIIVVVFIFSLFLPKCGNYIRNDAMAVCGTYAVPGMALRDMKGEAYECSIIEKDSAGRLLYAFTARSIVTGELETALVICQTYDSNYVYFYEDMCYTLSDYDQADIETLKHQNDWDKSLDENKLSRRKIVISFDSYIMIQPKLKINDVLEACQRSIDSGRISILDIQFIDSDAFGKELYYFTTEDGLSAYFAITDASGEVRLLPIHENALDEAEFVKFKQENGWQYGY